MYLASVPAGTYRCKTTGFVILNVASDPSAVERQAGSRWTDPGRSSTGWLKTPGQVPPEPSARAMAGFTVLREWHTPPGVCPDGTVDADTLRNWVTEASKRGANMALKRPSARVKGWQKCQLSTVAPPGP
jgi:hypothetical protein